MSADDVDDVEHVESGGSSYRDTLDEWREAVFERNWIGGIQAAALAVFVLPFVVLTPVVRSLPPAWKLYHRLHVWSAYQMQKAAKADALANVRRANDHEDVLPAKFVEGSEEDNDLTGWTVKGLDAKRYDTGVRGGASSRFGKASLIHVNEDDTKQATWAEAAIDNAFAADRENYLFRDAEVRADQFILDAGAGAGQAVADGGFEPANVRTSRVSVDRPGVLEDVLVPLSSRDGFDGQVVSWNQISNIQQESSDQETVRNAKNSGWMAAKMDDVNGTDVLKWVLIAAAWSALLLFHQDIGAAIAGFGGGNAVGDAASGAGLGMISTAKLALGVGV